jgi:ribosome maturation factor RimP
VTDEQLTREALQAAVAVLGFELVEAEVGGAAAARQVRLRIDRVGGSAPGDGVTTEDCARVSRALEARLEEAGAVSGAWRLEVSSPGIERPVRFAIHWRRYVGQDVRVRARGIVGRQVARIAAVPDDRHVELDVAGVRQLVPLEAIKDAILVVDWSAIG